MLVCLRECAGGSWRGEALRMMDLRGLREWIIMIGGG